jgi:protein TonB
MQWVADWSPERRAGVGPERYRLALGDSLWAAAQSDGVEPAEAPVRPEQLPYVPPESPNVAEALRAESEALFTEAAPGFLPIPKSPSPGLDLRPIRRAEQRQEPLAPGQDVDPLATPTALDNPSPADATPPAGLAPAELAETPKAAPTNDQPLPQDQADESAEAKPSVTKTPASETADSAAPATAEAAASQAPAAQRGGGANEPVLIEAPEPRYPRRALDLGKEGSVRIEIDVAPDGTVLDARVLTSSGYAPFDEAALDAVRRWRFAAQPANATGSPAQFRHQFHFRLPKD